MIVISSENCLAFEELTLYKFGQALVMRIPSVHERFCQMVSVTKGANG